MRRQIAAAVLLALLLLLPTDGWAQETGLGEVYVVQVNDTLWKLAEKYLGDGNRYPDIVAATNAMASRNPTLSPIANPHLLQPGQRLWIPASGAALPAPAPAAPPPAPSAGGHIAFSFWNGNPNRCTYEIDLIRVADCLQGEEACRATRRIFPLNNVSEPALSPDGTRLAFRGWGQPPSPDNPYVGCAPAHPYRYLGHATPDGTDFVGVGGFWEDSHPDWSPDGTRLLFDSSRLGDGVSRIYLINADGSAERSLFIAGEEPSWAPDGERFVYRGCDLTGNRCGLWLARAFEPKSWETGDNMIGPLVQSEGVAHPDWSPVREEIVYQRNEGGNWNLWFANADGSGNRRLTNAPGIEGLPVWSPDGEWIAYLAHDGQNWTLRILRRDGSGDRLLFLYDGGTYTLPVAAEPYGLRSWLDEQISWGP